MTNLAREGRISQKLTRQLFFRLVDVTFSHLFFFSQLSVLLEIGHPPDLQGGPFLVCCRRIYSRQAGSQQRAGLLGSSLRQGEAIPELVSFFFVRGHSFWSADRCQSCITPNAYCKLSKLRSIQTTSVIWRSDFRAVEFFFFFCGPRTYFTCCALPTDASRSLYPHTRRVL